jgi:site-specific recombinase XerD
MRSSGEIDALVSDYLRKHYLAVRGNGYGVVLTHRAKIVTRRHLVWLEQRGLLPAGTAAQGASWSDSASPPATVAEDSRALTARHGKSESRALLDYVLARVDSELPPPLRQPLLDYLEHLARDRELAKSSIEASLRTNVALVRKMAAAGNGSFTQLRVSQLDEVVSSLLRSPPPELIHRRQQVRAHHSRLRGFLRYLYRRRLLDRDLASALISPPCYRASTPVTVLSEQQLQHLLESVDRRRPRGQRCYTILTLMTTYGLRPVDVSHLLLDDLHWRDARIAMVQKKTGRVVALPLLPQVATPLCDYLRHVRPPGLADRHVFVSLSWPHHAVRSAAICADVANALAACGLSSSRPRHLRASVATHLLRQGEALSTIQEVLGHRTAETTQRYAATDLEMLRQVLEEIER